MPERITGVVRSEPREPTPAELRKVLPLIPREQLSGHDVDERYKKITLAVLTREQHGIRDASPYLPPKGEPNHVLFIEARSRADHNTIRYALLKEGFTENIWKPKRVNRQVINL
jgi:hypothetical protein